MGLLDRRSLDPSTTSTHPDSEITAEQKTTTDGTDNAEEKTEVVTVETEGDQYTETVPNQSDVADSREVDEEDHDSRIDETSDLTTQRNIENDTVNRTEACTSTARPDNCQVSSSKYSQYWLGYSSRMSARHIRDRMAPRAISLRPKTEREESELLVRRARGRCGLSSIRPRATVWAPEGILTR